MPCHLFCERKYLTFAYRQHIELVNLDPAPVRHWHPLPEHHLCWRVVDAALHDALESAREARRSWVSCKLGTISSLLAAEVRVPAPANSEGSDSTSVVSDTELPDPSSCRRSALPMWLSSWPTPFGSCSRLCQGWPLTGSSCWCAPLCSGS